MSDRKRNIVINWDPPRDPANSDEIYDKIEGYEIFHNLPQYDSPFVMGAADVSTGTVEVPEGTYSIGIQSYAADGLRSEKVIRNFQITNLLSSTVLLGIIIYRGRYFFWKTCVSITMKINIELY